MDILKIIQTSGLRFDYVAQRLFPENKHPYNALNRLINKKAELSESQIKTLADLAKVSADELLELPRWTGQIAGASIVLTKGEALVSYEPQLGVFELYRFIGSKVKEKVGTFAAPADLTVRQFLACVEDELEKLF